MKIKKNTALVLGIFILSIIFFFGHAFVTFWSGAEINWEDNIYSPTLEGKRIIIDPGHGGRDPGVHFNDIAEKDINWAIAKKLADLLEKKGAKVYFTREADKGIVSEEVLTLAESSKNLQKRRNMAEQEKAGLYLSLHVNSFKKQQVRGPIVFYKDNNFLNKILAEKLQGKLNNVTALKKEIKEANYKVLDQDIVPSVLIEVGFITNTKDLELMTSELGQQNYVEAIVEGLVDYGSYLEELQDILDD